MTEHLSTIAQLRESTDYRDWEYCDACNGNGSVPDANFWCHVCDGEGGTWGELDLTFAALLDVAEAAQAEFGCEPIPYEDCDPNCGHCRIVTALAALNGLLPQELPE